MLEDEALKDDEGEACQDDLPGGAFEDETAKDRVVLELGDTPAV